MHSNKWTTNESALDLSIIGDGSSVNGAVIDQLTCDLVALSAGSIAMPNSDKIPFHITSSGHLVLANFTAERINGNFIFKQVPLNVVQNPLVFAGGSAIANFPHQSAVDQMFAPTELPVNYGHHLQVTNADESSGSVKSLDDVDVFSRHVYLLVKEMQNEDNGDVMIEGHNLTHLVAFATKLKHFRRRLALSQLELSQKLSSSFPDQSIFSQSFLSRFEKMHVSLRAALNAEPYLQRWLEEAERTYSMQLLSPVATNDEFQVNSVGDAHRNACARVGRRPICADYIRPRFVQSPSSESDEHDNMVSEALLDLRDPQQRSQPRTESAHDNSEPEAPPPQGSVAAVEFSNTAGLPLRRRRKTRTFFNAEAVRKLNSYYLRNSMPRGGELTQLALELGFQRESVRMWFSNRRQLEKNPKKQVGLKTPGHTTPSNLLNEVGADISAANNC